MGDRIDHMTVNLQGLTYLAKINMQGFLLVSDNVITAITNQKLRL